MIKKDDSYKYRISYKNLFNYAISGEMLDSYVSEMLYKWNVLPEEIKIELIIEPCKNLLNVPNVF